MTPRERLTILQHAVQNAITKGYHQEAYTILDVNIILDPPSICIRREPTSTDGDNDVYLDPMFPLLETEFAIAFWGSHMMPSQVYIVQPAWKYHQHRLLEYLQEGDIDSYYRYIEFFL